ncbi:MAG: hypothetical protein KGJ73_02335 [Rhodospirillales bacterium]|nr:hypothetical protein [Rhodospirillales bacterium]
MKNQTTVTFQTADLKHIRSALSARADALLARLSKDPAIRDFSKREAARCRKMAEAIATILRSIG